VREPSASSRTTFTDADDIWGNGAVTNRASAGVDAPYGAEKTFDFYKNVLGRNGIWNTGAGARSRVHYGTNYVNAFWDGTQMTYGDGASNTHPLVELDIAGHEMSHGVTQATAGLVYTGDAGGLNEATSDIFGTAVEWYTNNASDNPDYLIGELIDIFGRFGFADGASTTTNITTARPILRLSGLNTTAASAPSPATAKP